MLPESMQVALTFPRQFLALRPSDSPHEPLILSRFLWPLELSGQEQISRDYVDSHEPSRLDPQSMVMIVPKDSLQITQQPGQCFDIRLGRFLLQ